MAVHDTAQGIGHLVEVPNHRSSRTMMGGGRIRRVLLPSIFIVIDQPVGDVQLVGRSLCVHR